MLPLTPHERMPHYKLNNDNIGDPNQVNVLPTEWTKPLIKPIRFSPICLTSMSWLPKFAACPMCGMKPMPVVDDSHMNNQLTADQILIDCLGKSQENVDCESPCISAMNRKRDRETSKVDPDSCHCTCKFGKEYAHCRIRKLCKRRIKLILEFSHTAEQRKPNRRSKISRRNESHVQGHKCS